MYSLFTLPGSRLIFTLVCLTKPKDQSWGRTRDHVGVAIVLVLLRSTFVQIFGVELGLSDPPEHAELNVGDLVLYAFRQDRSQRLQRHPLFQHPQLPAVRHPSFGPVLFYHL